MLIKCEKCGYENFPQHRFCGMCAAELRIPTAAGAQPAPLPRRVPAPAAPPPKPSVPTSVSGPSFLGLANEPTDTRSVSYLLEDEPEPSHRGRYLWLIVLVAAIAAGWYWRHDLGSLAAKVSSRCGERGAEFFCAECVGFDCGNGSREQREFRRSGREAERRRWRSGGAGPDFAGCRSRSRAVQRGGCGSVLAAGSVAAV